MALGHSLQYIHRSGPGWMTHPRPYCIRLSVEHFQGLQSEGSVLPSTKYSLSDAENGYNRCFDNSKHYLESCKIMPLHVLLPNCIVIEISHSPDCRGGESRMQQDFFALIKQCSTCLESGCLLAPFHILYSKHPEILQKLDHITVETEHQY